MRIEYCPKGHGDWTLIPASTLYYQIIWCEKCECFYENTLKKVTSESLNKNFSCDRAKELIDYARFIKWKSGLSMSDMKKFNPQTPDTRGD